MKKVIIIGFLIFPVLMIFGQDNSSLNIVAKEGRDAIYLFLNDKVQVRNNNNQFSEIIISRSIGKAGNYTQIGSLKPLTDIESFRASGGEKVLNDISRINNLKDDLQTWDFIVKHPSLKSYGLMTLDMMFLQVMGFAFADKNTGNIGDKTMVWYKVEYISAGGAGHKYAVETSLEKGIPPVIARPKTVSFSERNSIISVTWKADESKSPDALFGEVWRRSQDEKSFKKVSLCFANHDSKKGVINYFVNDKVKPHAKFSYFVKPLTITMRPGPCSDTLTAISVDFTRLPQPATMSATDTSSGIFLSWEPLKDPFLYSGIVIERTKDKGKGYMQHDTVASTAVSYLDLKVLPGGLYSYRLQCITLRGSLPGRSAYATVLHQAALLVPDAPVLKSLDAQKKSIKISWIKNNHPETAGYYVYRKNNL
jgi:hypothetical protein